MSNSIVYNAAEHDIHSVTVFQVNRAEVTRRIKVDLKQGQNEILVKNLPSVLDGDSIRVDGIGKAVVFDVIYKRPQYPFQHAASKDKESPEIEELQGHRSSLIREKEVAEKQRSILDTYSKTVSSEHAKSDALSDFLQIYGTSQLEYSTKLHGLEEKIRAVDDKIKDAREAEGKLAGDSKLGTRVVVIALAEEDGPAELDLKYNVTGASWTPVYDLRAEVANASSDANGAASGKAAAAASNSKISLDYRASISQRTAEDWKNVNVTLSTASPQLGSAIPTLSAVRLDGIPHAVPMKKSAPATNVRARGAPPGNAFMKSMTVEETEESEDDMGFLMLDEDAAPQASAFASAPRFFAHAGSKVSGSGEGFSSAFVIDGLSNIPSDKDDSSESHKVTIAVVQLDNVDLEWVTVPKRSLSVFLKARVKNTTEYTFLAGGASIFMNNNFVAKSNIPRVSPLEFFSVSLGIDSSVRVTYHPQSKKINNPTGGFISAARVSTTFQQGISIKNTRNAPLSRLVVKDQVPTSTHAQIRVSVYEPALPEVHVSKPGGGGGTIKSSSGTAQASSSSNSSAALKEVPVSANGDIRARWARINEESDGAGGVNVARAGGEVNTEGLMEWICRVDTGSGVDLKLGWEVNVPKGFAWKQT